MGGGGAGGVLRPGGSSVIKGGALGPFAWCCLGLKGCI